jgi:hypothetical protein
VSAIGGRAVELHGAQHVARGRGRGGRERGRGSRG